MIKKSIFGFIGAFAALTIGTAAVSANILNNAGNAAGDIIHGAGNAAGDIVHGAGNAAGDIIRGAEGVVDGNDDDNMGKDGNGNVLGDTNDMTTTNEATTEPENSTTEPEHSTTAMTTAITSATTSTAASDTNPTTGSFEIVTFGALALGSLAIAASTTRRKR